jgi:hypothetical protein
MNPKHVPLDSYLKYKRRSGAVNLMDQERDDQSKEDETTSPKLKPSVMKWSIRNWILSNKAKNIQEKSSQVVIF